MMIDNSERVVRKVSSYMHRIGTELCLPVLTLIVALDVVLRYFFNSPLAWTHEANGLLLLCVFMLSIIACWHEDKHIRMELLYERFGSRLKGISDILSNMIGIFIFFFLSFRAFQVIPYMIRTHEVMDELPIPLWPFMGVIAVVSLFFCLNLVFGLIRSVKKLFQISSSMVISDSLDT